MFQFSRSTGSSCDLAAGDIISDGTWTYTWEHGRQLASMSGGTTWNYTYDADGMRTGRSNGSTAYSYIYTGGQLTQMTVGGNTLTFTSDATGNPQTVTYNGTTYYYAVNLQGDVVAILDRTGTAMVSYTYDAWGNLCDTTGTLATTLGAHNPLRYRGYVYDQGIGLYYLQSRYYNPTLGRFLNADALVATGQGLLGNNMFAYCGNNPINRTDPLGTLYTPAEIHNFVVDDICRVDPNKTRKQPKIKYKEIYFEHEYGFCDVYDISTHEVWEVKRIDGGVSCSIKMAKKQLENYVFNGVLQAHEEWELKVGGTQTTVSGNCFAIRDKDGRGTYIIGYWDISEYSPVSGIIFYDYIYIPDPQEAVNAIGALLGIGIGVYLYTHFEADFVRLGGRAVA